MLQFFNDIYVILIIIFIYFNKYDYKCNYFIFNIIFFNMIYWWRLYVEMFKCFVNGLFIITLLFYTVSY